VRIKVVFWETLPARRFICLKKQYTSYC